MRHVCSSYTQANTASYPYALGICTLSNPCQDICMPILISPIHTPMPTRKPQRRCIHTNPVNVLCCHVVVIHALTAYQTIRCVLHMDPRKAVNVGISLVHTLRRRVVVGIRGLLCRRTTMLLLLPVPRADGTVALGARGGLDGRLVLLVLVNFSCT